MKRLTCEMCGCTDLIKQEGVFVCQACGCKYSIEEARKLMIEGTVDVSGSTVKVDVSEELNNLYQIARRSKDAENHENAAKYYDMILVKDPSSWEANFYSVYYKTMSCKIGEISVAATNVSNCIKETFRLIKDNVSNGEERKNAIWEVWERVQKISKMLFDAATSHMNSIDPLVKQKFQGQYLANAIAAGGIPATVCDNLCDVFADDDEVMGTVGIQILKERIAEKINIETATRYAQVIKKYDSTYQMPENKPTDNIKSSNSNSEGCYVATAVYGSYDCPQVWTLRRFRDYTLAKTWYGRVFIRIYYTVSPFLVREFGNTEWFKKMWKGKLDYMVKTLNAKGIKNTPYSDRKW